MPEPNSHEQQKGNPTSADEVDDAGEPRDCRTEEESWETVFTTSVPSSAGQASEHPQQGNLSSLDTSRYQLNEEIARGGMGVVFRGRDRLLGRELAFKVLLDSNRDHPDIIQRFVEEAQINGQLQHPGIVPVHELGALNDQRPFFAMKLVEGHTLSALLQRRESLEQDRSHFLGVFEQVCQTVAFAHSRGVIHRDLKPSNVMVGAFGEVQVMDWGLAKVLSKDTTPPAQTISSGDVGVSRSTGTQGVNRPIRTVRNQSPAGTTDSGSQTRVGAIIGTPAFMAPEQAVGDPSQIDERADVFGLGAILTVILTGKPPYVADSITDLLDLSTRGVIQDAYARLDTSGAEPSLVKLAKRCLSVNPLDRPRDGGAVAKELTAYLESVAQRLHDAEMERLAAETRAAEEVKRRRVVIALAASVLALVLLSGGGWSYVQQQRTRLAEAATGAAIQEAQRQQEKVRLEEKAKIDAIDAGNREASLRREALEAKQRTELTLADVYAARGLQAGGSGRAALASIWFAAASDQSAADPNRRRENHLRARNWSRDAIVPVAAINVAPSAQRLHFQPGGSLLLILQESGYVLWDWKTNRLLPWLDGSRSIGVACWHPDGSKLAVASPEGYLEIRLVPSGEVIMSLPHDERIHSLAYSRDGRLLAVGSDSLRLFQMDKRSFSEAVWPHGQPVRYLQFTPDGQHLVSWDSGFQVRVFAINDPSKPAPLFSPILHRPSRIHSPPALIDQGRALLSITGERELSWWSIESGERLNRIDTAPTWALTHVVANPAGDQFAVGGYYGPDLYSVAHPDRKPIHLDHVNSVEHIVFSTDGSLMFTCSRDSTAQLWTGTGQALGPRLNLQGGTTCVAISDDNTLLATAQENQLVRVWQRPPDDLVVRSVDRWGERPRLSPDGTMVTPGMWHETTVVSSIPRSTLQVLSAHSGDPMGREISLAGTIRDSCIVNDNATLAVVSENQGVGFLTFWDIYSGAMKGSPWQLPGQPVAVNVRPLSTDIAVVFSDGRVSVLEPERRKSRYELNDHPGMERPERDKVITPGNPLQGNVEFTPDGRTLVYLSSHHRVHVIDAASGEPRFPPIDPLLNGRAPCRSIAISLDSQMLATGSNGAARIWSLTDGSELCKPLLHVADFAGMGSVAFSADGQRLLTANTDYRARLWDWRRGELACPPMLHEDMVYTAALTADGRFAITGARGTDCGPHVWELTTGRRIAPSRPAPMGGMVFYSARSLVVTPDQRRLIVSTGEGDSLEIINLEDLLRDPEIPVEAIRLLCELATSQSVDSSDTNTLTHEQWNDRWNQLRQRQLSYGRWQPQDVVQRHLEVAKGLMESKDYLAAQSHLLEALREINDADMDATTRLLLRTKVWIPFARLPLSNVEAERLNEDLRKAKEELESLVDSRPDDQNTIEALADLLFEIARTTNQEPRSISQLATIVQPLQLTGSAKLGVAYLASGQFEKAVPRLAIDAERDPEMLERQWLLALAQFFAGQDSAAGTYERALALARKADVNQRLLPLTEFSMREVGKMSADDIDTTLRQWKLENLITPFTQAILQSPESASAHLNRGQMYAMYGEWENAAIDLANAIRLEPSESYARYQLAFLYAHREDPSSYKSHCESLLGLWNDHADVSFADRTMMACCLRADALTDFGQLEELAQAVRSVAETHQYGNWFYRGLGLFAYRRGDFRLAIEDCQKSRRRNGEQEIAVITAADHVIEAMAYHQIGNTGNASQSLRLAKEYLEHRLPNPAVTPLGNFWHDWLLVDLLYREAKGLGIE